MSRIFITGSADGLGRMAAQLLVAEGHSVVLHARSKARARDAMAAVPGAEEAIAGDLSSLSETRDVAAQVNELGAFDAVIHNAAVGYREPLIKTSDGLPHVFAVNTLAPYILTALIDRPKRLIYVSSGLHRGADSTLQDLTWSKRAWSGIKAYSDTKFHDAALAFAVARKWSNALSNSLEPGWVATKMGGPSAPDDLEAAPKIQVWLATSNDPQALVTGQYFYHQRPRDPDPATRDVKVQERLLAECARISGVPFPD
jgi:NAD(P)-dependent dehydrogenase (short-subunit alcohol dehydrogenase family)